jgi:exodeoxyribonuclease VII large subunit
LTELLLKTKIVGVMPDLFSTSNQTNVNTATEVQDGASADFLDDFLNPKAKAKELSDQLSWIQTQRKTDYLDDALQLKSHKSVQVRRKLASLIGFLGNSEFIPKLQEWQIAEPDRQTWLLIESAIDRLNRGQAGENLDQSERVYTVPEALAQVKQLVSEKDYTIEGEVSEVRAVRQMYYFALKGGEETRIDCWAFAGKIVRAGFPLNEGLSIRIHGKFKLSKYSKIYFDVDRVELTGEGELLRNLKLLEQKLTQEGLFDPARKRQPRSFPDNVLLIASESSAAISDFLKVVSRRRGGLNIYHLPIKTQGVGAEYEILEAFGRVSDLVQEYQIDTIVMTRGGGSKDDLIVFNSEKVVRALHSLPKPTIVAIGHERDTSLAELAADVRASTPSQAAELVSRSKDEVLTEVQSRKHFLSSYFGTRIAQYRQANSQLWLLSLGLVSNRLKEAREFGRSLDHLVYSLIGQSRSQVDQMIYTISQSFRGLVDSRKRILQNLETYPRQFLSQVYETRFASSQVVSDIYKLQTSKLQEYKVKLSEVMGGINLSDPKKVLNRGFAMVWQGDKVVESSQDLDTSKDLEIEFKDGRKKIS